MKVNACMISLVLIAIVAILLLLNQPNFARSKYSDREMDNGMPTSESKAMSEAYGMSQYEHEMMDGDEMMEGDEMMDGMGMESCCG